MSERIENLKLLIERSEKCRASHVESGVIALKVESKTVWEGVVETFQLEGHPLLSRVYGWVVPASPENPEPVYKIVLGVPPVNSAQDAVSIAFADEVKRLIRLADESRGGDQE